MKREKKTLFIIVQVMIVLSLTGCRKQEKTVATIDREYNITVNELMDSFFKIRRSGPADSVTVDMLRSHLDKVIDEKIKLRAAYQAGLDNDEQINEEMDKLTRKELLQTLYQRVIVDPVVMDSDIRDFYTRSGKEVVVRSIFLNCPEGLNPEKVDSIRTQAESIYRDLKSGMAFSAAAKSYSQDKSSALRGGLMNAMKYTQSSDPVQRAVFSLNIDQISKPIQSRTGFHILKVEDIKPVEQLSFKDSYDKIRNNLINERRTELSNQTKKYIETLKQKKKFSWNETALDSISSWAKIMFESDNTNFSQDSLDQKISQLADVNLLTYKGGKVMGRDFQEGLNKMYSPRFAEKEELKRYIESGTLQELLYLDAIARGLLQDNQVVSKLLEQKEYKMLQILEKNDLIGTIDLSEEELKEYYETHKAEKYLSKDTKDIQSFEKVRLRVRSDLKTAIEESRKQKWLEEKRKTTSIKIYEKVLKNVLD